MSFSIRCKSIFHLSFLLNGEKKKKTVNWQLDLIVCFHELIQSLNKSRVNSSFFIFLVNLGTFIVISDLNLVGTCTGILEICILCVSVYMFYKVNKTNRNM